MIREIVIVVVVNGDMVIVEVVIKLICNVC